MTGQREIEGLRRLLSERDGARFDLRAFHDQVIGHGSLPLATLRRELPRWVRPGRADEPAARSGPSPSPSSAVVPQARWPPSTWRSQRSAVRRRIVVIEPAPELGLGVAYGTRSPSHLLNVRAGGMSAYPERPGHFLTWARAAGDRGDRR